MRYITLKKEQNNYSKYSASLLLNFCTYFFYLVFAYGGEGGREYSFVVI